MIQNQLTVKSQPKHLVHSKYPLKKACFGTKEWSKNSGICNRCNYKADCGKIEETRKSKEL